MDSFEEESIPSIGSELLCHAQEFGEPNRLPLTTQLFPFLFLASRRMTTRQMSEWLEKSKGVKLSAPMISKGLKRPELHLSRIAEHVQPMASYLGTLFDRDAEELLFGEDPQSGVTVFKQFEDHIWQASDHLSDDAKDVLRSFSDSWDQIPQEVKFMCRRYFDITEFAENAEDDDDESNEPLSPQLA